MVESAGLATSPDANTQDVSLCIKECRLEYSHLWKRYKIFLSISIGRDSRKTTISKTGTWNEELNFVGNIDSTMQFVVYRKRRLGRDDVLGTSTVELASLANDELVIHTLEHSTGPPITIQFKVSVLTLADISCAVAKIEENLVSDTLERIVGRLDILVAISTSLSELNPIAKMAVSLLRNAHDAVRAQISRDEKVAKLMEAMLEACAFLDDTTDAKRRICESDGQMRLVHKLMTDIIECYHFVRKYASKKFVSRLVSNLRADLQNDIPRYSDKFKEFQSHWSIRAIAHTQSSAHQILRMTQRQASLALLEQLPYSKDAHYDTGIEPPLLSPTCNLVALSVNEWASRTDEDVQRLFVLYGDDPSRMSAIAENVARACNGSGRLASSFFFGKSNTEYRKSHLLFPTIARDLADANVGFRRAVEDALDGSMRLRRYTSLSEQFKHLFLDAIMQSSFKDPAVLVVDACAPEIIHLLLDYSNELPRNARIFVTSRPGDAAPPPLAMVAGVMVQSLGKEPVNFQSCDWHAKWKIDQVDRISMIFSELFFFDPRCLGISQYIHNTQ